VLVLVDGADPVDGAPSRLFPSSGSFRGTAPGTRRTLPLR
jgi:hypothetical protein